MQEKAVVKILEKHFVCSGLNIQCVECNKVMGIFNNASYVQNSVGIRCSCGKDYLVTAIIDNNIVIYKKANFVNVAEELRKD